jgi:threonine/homoserine/homoserine lactone efflux protein
MKTLQNIAVGFLVSFLGSIPLGYLNVIGFHLYRYSGMDSLIPFLFGVMTIEGFVIYGTLVFADRLMRNKKLLKYIEGFSVLFMFVMAFTFYTGAQHPKEQQDIFEKYVQYSPYILGVLLSCFNFIQLPFWMSWNLYVLNGKYIEVKNSGKFIYLVGTLLGTFAGMMLLILSLSRLTSQTEFLTKNVMLYIIPAVFIALGIFQAIQFYKKYCQKR